MVGKNSQFPCTGGSSDAQLPVEESGPGSLIRIAEDQSATERIGDGERSGEAMGAVPTPDGSDARPQNASLIEVGQQEPGQELDILLQRVITQVEGCRIGPQVDEDHVVLVPLQPYFAGDSVLRFCLWRTLLHAELQMQGWLQKLRPEFSDFVSEFDAESRRGRDAVGTGNHDRALHSLLRCKQLIQTTPLGNATKTSLIPWVDHFLALAYQSVGRIEEVMDLRKKMLEYVESLSTNDKLVYKLYYYTAQYQLGDALGDPKIKYEAIQSYTELQVGPANDAEAEIQYLLCVDCECLGTFADSLRWIRGSIELRKNDKSGQNSWDRVKDFYILHEATLLMKLEEFLDAKKLLYENLPDYLRVPSPALGSIRQVYTESRGTQQAKRMGSEIDTALKKLGMLEECYEQILRKYLGVAVPRQLANEFTGLREVRRSLQMTRNILLSPNHGISPNFPHPGFWDDLRTATYIGSSKLGLVRANSWRSGLGPHLDKLPFNVVRCFQFILKRERDARQEGNLWLSMQWFEVMRELLKMARKPLDIENYDWLLSWVDVPLAGLYHCHAKQFEKAIEIYEEIQECVKHGMASAECESESLLQEQLQIPRAALEYELFRIDMSQQDSDAKLEYMRRSQLGMNDDVIQKWARAHCIDRNRAERDLCFWLYFGYHRHGNFEDALKWLRKAKEHGGQLVSNSSCPGERGPKMDYFCCDFDYSRCENELLSGLNPEARDQEEAIALNAKLLHGLMDIDDYDEEDCVQEKFPTPTGCESLTVVDRDAVLRLVQSSAGFDHHLFKLPLSIQLAFRKHAYLARMYDMERADWEKAIFHNELCREILETCGQVPSEIGGVFDMDSLWSDSMLKKSYDWLTVWVTVPLADLYQFRMKQCKKALDLWIEIWALNMPPSIMSNSDVIYKALLLYIHLGLRVCFASANQGIEGFARHLGWVERDPKWESDCHWLFMLSRHYRAHEDYEGALDFAGLAQQLFEHRCPDPEQRKGRDLYIFILEEKALCLHNLRAVNLLTENLTAFWRLSGKPASKLSEVSLVLSGLFEDTILSRERRETRRQIFLPERDIFDFPGEDPMVASTVAELTNQSSRFELDGEYHEAIKCREKCLDLIKGEPTLAKKLHLYGEIGFEHYWALARLHHYLFVEFTDSAIHQIPLFLEDVNFSKAEKYYKKATSVSRPPWSWAKDSNFSVSVLCIQQLNLYYFVWCHYNAYLNGLMNRDGIRDQTRQAIRTYLERIQKIPIQKLGERVIKHFGRMLRTLKHKQYMEDWIELLENHKSVYSFLQSYHWSTAMYYRYEDHFFQRNFEDMFSSFIVAMPDNLSWASYVSNEDNLHIILSEGVWEEHTLKGFQSSFLAFRYAEGVLSRAMLSEFEMYSHKNVGTSVKQLIGYNGFHDGIDSALRLFNDCEDLLKRIGQSTVFVLYGEGADCFGKCYHTYVIRTNEVGQVSFRSDISVVTLTKDESASANTQSTPESRLDDLYNYLEYKSYHPDHKEIQLCKGRDCLRYKAHRVLRKSHSTIKNDASMNEYLEFLYDELIEPFAKLLKPRDNLVLAPCELLTRVPFGALKNRRNDKYLMESYTIAMVPSLRVLLMCSKHLQDLQLSPFKVNCGSIVALGNPTYNACRECRDGRSPQRKSLPMTGKEVEMIAEIFRDTGAVKKLTEEHATANQLLEWAAIPYQQSFRQAIFHIGAHGAVHQEDHRKNHLQLACDDVLAESASGPSTSSGGQASTSDHWTRSTEEDEENRVDSSDDDTSDSESGTDVKRSSGVSTSHDLTVEKIIQLETPWSAELLVLSACETAAGKRTAEGVLSLARAFMAAGVPCVVASLWKVEDTASFHLQETFYGKLRKGINAASALQSAALCNMKKYGREAVQFWAPFNVWGVPSLCIPEELQEKKVDMQQGGCCDTTAFHASQP